MSLKLDLISVGKLKSGPERDLCQRYAERLNGLARGLGLEGPRLVELSESPARRDADRKAEEAVAILAAVPDGHKLILFDEDGTSFDSPAFAARIGEWRDAGTPGASFIIGGADGLDTNLRKRAHLVLAFGKMTMPHQIVRILVLEQLYRAATILAGHPYHRP